MDWERMIPGHPGPGDRLGTKKDAQDVLTLMQEASADDQDRGPGRQVLGHGREGLQDAEIRDPAGLRRTASAWWRGATAGCGAAAPERRGDVTVWAAANPRGGLFARDTRAKETIHATLCTRRAGMPARHP